MQRFRTWRFPVQSSDFSRDCQYTHAADKGCQQFEGHARMCVIRSTTNLDPAGLWSQLLRNPSTLKAATWDWKSGHTLMMHNKAIQKPEGKCGLSRRNLDTCTCHLLWSKLRPDLCTTPPHPQPGGGTVLTHLRSLSPRVKKWMSRKQGESTNRVSIQLAKLLTAHFNRASLYYCKGWKLGISTCHALVKKAFI